MTKINSVFRETDNVDRQARDWLLHLQSGKATVQDADDFRRWQSQSPEHVEAYKKACQLWSLLGTAADNITRRQPDLIQLDPPFHRKISRRALLTSGAIAASAALLVLNPPFQLWPSADELLADYRTGTGEQKQVRLNDHVVVEMNTRTRINHLALAHNQDVLELIDGEAEFRALETKDLAEEHSLNLLVNQGWIRASSATFNVRFLSGIVSLTCLEGRVELRHPLGIVELTNGLQLTYNQQAILSRRTVDLQQTDNWRTGWLVFRDTPLEQAINEINRYRPGRILLRNTSLKQRRLQGRFAINGLADFPVMIADSYDASITRLPGGIVILS